jgi:hypothetical protein
VIGDNNPAFENQRIIQKVYSCSFCDWCNTLECLFSKKSFIG